MVMHLHVVVVVVYGTERNWIFVYYEEENVGFYAFAAASSVVRCSTTHDANYSNDESGLRCAILRHTFGCSKCGTYKWPTNRTFHHNTSTLCANRFASHWESRVFFMRIDAFTCERGGTNAERCHHQGETTKVFGQIIRKENTVCTVGHETSSGTKLAASVYLCVRRRLCDRD